MKRIRNTKELFGPDAVGVPARLSPVRIARWESRGKKHWVEVIDNRDGSFSIRSSHGGGVAYSEQEAMRDGWQLAMYANVKMKRVQNPIRRSRNPKKARGRRFAVGDRVRLRGDYDAGSVGIVDAMLANNKIRVNYPERRMAIDARVSEFMPIRRKRRRNPVHRMGESRSGFKFSSSLSEYLREQADMGADDEIGSVDELGWYALLLFKDEPLYVDDDGVRSKYRAAIVAEYNDGSTDYEVYTSLREAKDKWRGINKRYSRFYRETE